MLKVHKRISLIVGVFLILMLAGCATASPTPAGEPTDPPNGAPAPETTPADNDNADVPAQDVTLVLDWTPNTNHTGFYVALERGYFEAEGLNVEIVQPPEDGALALVGAGRADFGISFQEDVLMAANADAPMPVVAIAALVEHNTSGVLALADSGITRFSDLEGRTFGSWMIPIYDEIIKEAVRLDGGDPELVQFVPHTAMDNITGLRREEFDAVWVFEGWDKPLAQQEGLDTVFLSLREINPVFDYYTPVLVTNETMLETDVVARFLRASAQGYQYAKDNPRSAAEILHSFAPEVDLEILAASQEFLSAAYFSAEWGVIDDARWNAFFDWMRERELVVSDADNAAFRNIDF